MQVDKGRVLHEIMLRLDKLKNEEGILLQPYKKDRSIWVLQRENQYYLYERGFTKKMLVGVQSSHVKSNNRHPIAMFSKGVKAYILTIVVVSASSGYYIANNKKGGNMFL